MRDQFFETHTLSLHGFRDPSVATTRDFLLLGTLPGELVVSENMVFYEMIMVRRANHLEKLVVQGKAWHGRAVDRVTDRRFCAEREEA